MEIIIKLDNGQKQTIEIPLFDKEHFTQEIRNELGTLEAEMRGHLAEVTEKDKKLLGNFIRGKLTAYNELHSLLSKI